MLTDQERAELINKIRILPEQLEALVAPLDDRQLHTHFLPHEWTVAQNIHHLADSHMNSFISMKLTLTEEYPTLKPYDQDVWAQTADYDLPISTSLSMLQGLHARWTTLLESITDEQWERTAFHPENGDMTLERMLRYYAVHGEGHIDQITRTLAADDKSA